MPIELIIKIGIGVFFGGLICVAVLSFIHRRAIKLTERRLESAFEHSTAQAQADKELLQTILAHAKAQMINLDKKESAINRLDSEFAALKIEVESLKTKFESTCSGHLNEQMNLVPLAPTISQAALKDMRTRGGLQPDGTKQFRQEDTWVRDQPYDGGESELQAVVQPPEKDSIARIDHYADQGGSNPREEKVPHSITKTEKDRLFQMQSGAG